MTVGRPAQGREGEIGEGGRHGIRADIGWGQTGGENMGPLLGDVPEYRRGRRRQGGGRRVADQFWDIQRPEQTERRFGIGITRDGAGQYGHRGFPRDKVDIPYCHPL